MSILPAFDTNKGLDVADVFSELSARFVSVRKFIFFESPETDNPPARGYKAFLQFLITPMHTVNVIA
jgi:hypothetical protein